MLNDGCGSVWSSGTVLPSSGWSCSTPPTAISPTPSRCPRQSSLCISTTGSLRGCTVPQFPDLDCDWDFGATVNAGDHASGAGHVPRGGRQGRDLLFVGSGHREDLRWSTNVVFGGFSGGFIATTAFDGQRVYGSTALGDFGRFEKDTQVLCDPSNPRDTPKQEPTVHAFDAATGAVEWQADSAPSFAPTTVANGMTFNGPTLAGNILQVREAATGQLIDTVPVPGPIWSGVATVGDALVTGIGSSYVAHPAGVAVLTPGGARPVAGP